MSVERYLFTDDDISSYIFDSLKLNISSNVEKLKLQQGNVDFTEDFVDDTDFTYDSDLAEFLSNKVQQKSQVLALSGANFNTNVNFEDWSIGIKTGTVYNGAGITNGKLDLSGSVNKYIDYNADLNADMQQTGCIEFDWTPQYTGAGSFQYLFTIVEGVGLANNRIRMYHQSTLLFLAISDSTGGSIISVAEAFSPIAGETYKISLNFDITNGATRLFVDGTQLGTTQTGTGIRDNNIGLLRLGKDLNGNGNANFLIDNLIIYDTVQHTTDYIPSDSGVPTYKYANNSVILPEMEHTGDGFIKLFNSLTSTYTGSPRLLLEIGRSGNKLYWNGSAWIISDETYNQATDPITFNTNCSSLNVDGENYGQFTIIFPDSNTQSSYSELTANMNVDIGYLTTNPSTEVKESFDAKRITSFIETSTKTGNDEIKFILRKGDNWYYHNGTSWIISDGTYSQSNTSTEINNNLSTFLTTNDYIRLKWFHHSDDGTTTPILTSIEIYYENATGEGKLLGYSFNNPDTVANDGWGAILTPDELRYVYAFGNDLFAPNGQTISDDTLKWYIDQAVGNVERDLNITLLKKQFRHTPINQDGTEIERTDLDGLDPNIDFFWEDPYDFNRKFFNDFIFIKLRHRPIIEIKKVEFRDPTGHLIADIKTWKKVNYKMGSLEFFPHAGALMTLPMYTGGFYYNSPVRYLYDDYPDAYYIDYDAGFETADHLKKMYPELFTVVGKLAAINMLADYGDGKTAAVASSSLSLDGVSESLSTTLSATSAAFGARILQYQKDLSIFYKNNKNKYAGIQIGVL